MTLPTPLIALASLLFLGFSSPAAAQHYEGCFVNGQQVPDSMCQGGGAGASYGSGECNILCQGLRELIWGPSGPSSAEIARQRSNALNNEGRNLAQQGRKPEAVEKFRQARAADPSNAVAQANYYGVQAEIDFESGRLDVALANFRRALVYARSGDQEDNRLAIEGNIRMVEQAIALRNEEAEQQFARGRQDLLSQIRSVQPNPATSAPGNDEAQQQFARNQQTLLKEIRPLQTTPVAAVPVPDQQPGASDRSVDTLKDAVAAPRPKPKQAQKTAPHSQQAQQVKQVFPKTFKECNAEFQRLSEACRRPDGNLDAACYKPKEDWFNACRDHLSPEGWR